MERIITHVKSTSAVAIDTSVDPGVDFYLEEVRIHLSAAGGAGSMTISLDAAAGAEYDQVLDVQDLTALTNYSFVPDKSLHFVTGDKIKVVWANAGTKTYGLDVIYSKIRRA